MKRVLCGNNIFRCPCTRQPQVSIVRLLTKAGPYQTGLVNISSKEKENVRRQWKPSPPHINMGKEATLVPVTVKLLHKRKEDSSRWRSRGLQICLLICACKLKLCKNPRLPWGSSWGRDCNGDCERVRGCISPPFPGAWSPPCFWSELPYTNTRVS